jgi:two-component system cell cycle response regulator
MAPSKTPPHDLFDEETQTRPVPIPATIDQLVADAETDRAFSVPVPEVDARATLTVISGSGAGRIIALNRAFTLLGRASTSDLNFDDTAISRGHARVACERDGYVLEDLGSTNGTYLRGERITRQLLKSGDRFQLGPNSVLRFAVTDKLERDLLTRLVESSTRDPLTGAFNRAFFAQRLETELAYSKRHGTKVAVLLLDLDHFKAVNDTYGHATGDEVLRFVAREIARMLRIEDVLARHGGEEFAILARAATRLDSFRLAERIRERVAGLQIPVGDEGAGTLNITVTIGGARFLEGPQVDTAAELLKLADVRLYRAKANGRNTTCLGG